MIILLSVFYISFIKTSESSFKDVNPQSIINSKIEIQSSQKKFPETIDYSKLNIFPIGELKDEEESVLMKKIKSLHNLYYLKLVCKRKDKMFKEINFYNIKSDEKINKEVNENIKTKENKNENIKENEIIKPTNEIFSTEENQNKNKEILSTEENQNKRKEILIEENQNKNKEILIEENPEDSDKKNTEKKKFNLIQASKKKLGIIKEKINPTTMKDELSKSFESIPKEVQKLPGGSFYSSTADISIFQTEDSDTSDTSNNILFDFKEKDKKKRLLFWKK